MGGTLELVERPLCAEEVGGRGAPIAPPEPGGRGVPVADPCGHVEVAVLQLFYGFVHERQRLLEVRPSTPRGTQRTECGSAQPRGGWSLAGRVGDREPSAVAILDEVEPVPAHLVAG